MLMGIHTPAFLPHFPAVLSCAIFLAVRTFLFHFCVAYFAATIVATLLLQNRLPFGRHIHMRKYNKYMVVLYIVGAI